MSQNQSDDHSRGPVARFIRNLGPVESNLEEWLRKYLPFLYSRPLNPKWIEVKTLPVTLPGLDPAFDGYRLLQIGDIHMGTWMTPARLDTIIELVLDLSADLIAITGDFVGHNAEAWAAELTRLLSQLSAPDGVVAIMGNHDHWTNVELMRQMLAASGIRELRNDVLSLQRGQVQLHIAGVDDVWEQQADLEAVLAKLPPDGPAILLAHEPDFADTSAASGRFALQLSGHAHGGQMVLPFYGPALRVPYAEKYTMGLYQVGDMLQYTNRGLGTGVIPLRINCRPEISIFELQAPTPA